MTLSKPDLKKEKILPQRYSAIAACAIGTEFNMTEGPSTSEVKVPILQVVDSSKKLDTSARARRRWKVLKLVQKAIRRSSLKTHEAELLKAVGNKGFSPHNTSSSVEHIDLRTDVPESEGRSLLQKTINFYHSALTETELSFLESLLHTKDVSEEAFMNSVRVLENNELYQKRDEKSSVRMI